MPVRTTGLLAAALAAAAVALLVLTAVAASLGALATGALATGALATGSRGSSAAADASIPAPYLRDARAAAATCPGLPWTVLAGIARVETDFGADDHTSSAGAVGPMQFLPATFAEYAPPVPAGGRHPATPYDPVDAVYAAAHLLCANGARNGADVAGAIFAYNHASSYVAAVLTWARRYGPVVPAAAGPPAATSSPAAQVAVLYALDQVGTPYRWGAESPGVGFDCSGLTQAAYAAAGIAIPRTSEAQWASLPHVPLDRLEPGDLIFFDPAPRLPGHVGIYLGAGEMVDAPHAGADVRVEALAGWPTPMGAAAPVAPPPQGASG